jgi:hypothetical protein
MFADLPSRVHGKDINDFGIPVGCEKDAPATHARPPHAAAFSERRRKAKIERIFGELDDAGTEAAFGCTIKAVEGLFGLVRDRDPVTSQPAFALVLIEGLYAPCLHVREAAVEGV